MKNSYPVVLTIAGTDPSGGAGIQADIKSISATGSYAASVITVLVAQNTQAVFGIQKINADFVTQQIDCVFTDLDVKAVKIGMLYNQEIMMAVQSGFEKYRPKNIVIDPVMIANSGCTLLPEDSLLPLQELFSYACLITPNIPEAEKLLNITIPDQDAMEAAAATLASQFKTNVLLKGGHLNSDSASDSLYDYVEKKSYWYQSERIHTKNTHGTGCTLSSAIASYLAQEYSLHEAVSLAKTYLSRAIKAGSTLNIGKGAGPVAHFEK